MGVHDFDSMTGKPLQRSCSALPGMLEDILHTLGDCDLKETIGVYFKLNNPYSGSLQYVDII